MQPKAGTDSSRGLIAEVALDYWLGLKSLLTCPREIWIAYAAKILESVCYFSSVLVLMPFLTSDMGLSDVEAGTVFGVFSASMSFFMLFVGFIADSLGIKRALLIGLAIALVGRVAITFTTDPWIVYPGLFVLSVGFAYMIPLIAAAVKLFSTKRAQKYAYSWYYVVMNVGALLAGLSRDWLRAAFTEVMHFDISGMVLAVRPLQVIFLVAVLATLVTLLLTIFFIRETIPDEAFDHGSSEEKASTSETTVATAGTATGEKDGSSGTAGDVATEKGDSTVTTGDGAGEGAVSTKEAERKSAWRIMKEVVHERMFWIFILFIFLLILVKMIFQYNHSLYPLYMERIGLDDWTGKLYSINPFMIIFLVPIMTSLTHKMKSYNVILLGCFISASSVLIMGLGESILFIVLFQVFLSIGEALWSPRLYDYTATIAPAGKEASYMALSKVPMFFAKVGAGPVTGILLATLCPEVGARNTELMWIIVGASTLVSPIALLFGRKWLDVESRQKTLASSG